MVADNNKQPAIDNEVTPASHVGDGGKITRSKMSIPKVHNKKRIALIIVLILVVAGVAHYAFHVGEKVYAQAAGHKIYKKDIEKIIGNNKGVSDHAAATTLANKYLTEAMAKDAKITVDNQYLVSQYGITVNNEKTHNPYGYQVDVNNAYLNKLIAYNSGLYKGELLVTNFSAHIAYQSPFLDIQEARDPLLGNPAVIAADKKYAHDLITNLYNQIKSGKITFDQAIQIEHADPKVGYSIYSLAHSGPFDTSNVYDHAVNSLIAPVSIQKKIGSMKPGQTTPPFVVSVRNSLDDKQITTDSYYLVVRMNSTEGSHSGLTFNQYLAKYKKQLGYKVNV